MGRPESSRSSRHAPYKPIVRSEGGRNLLLGCGHTARIRNDGRPIPTRFAACRACWWIEKSREPGLKTYWFARVGRMLHRAWRWGQVMDAAFDDLWSDKLLVVRAENYREALKAAKRGDGVPYAAEEKQWHGLIPSPSRRASARRT